jgi:hypothetical protein
MAENQNGRGVAANRGLDAIRAVDLRSGGSGLMQASSYRTQPAAARAAAAQRRRAAARQRNGTGVHRWLRKIHQDDEHARANSTGASRGGGDEAQRRTADSDSGGAPAKSSQRLGARTPKQTAPLGSLPRGDATERLQSDRKAVTAKLKHDGRLGLRALAAAGARAIRVSGERPLGCGGGFIGVGELLVAWALLGRRTRGGNGGGGLSPYRTRREEGDDAWGPRVRDSGRPRRERKRARLGRLGH